ncbi:MAG: hypothetical protein GC162_12875 [Planctomycetes bacterium]|nr:hypothetical protein [Planctomycetota bacterium]
MPTQVFASSLALIGFAIAIVTGLAVDNPATTTLMRAIGAMIVCYIVGTILGAIGERAINEHLSQYKKKHPLPSLDDPEQSEDVLVIEHEPEGAAPVMDAGGRRDSKTARPTPVRGGAAA